MQEVTDAGAQAEEQQGEQGGAGGLLRDNRNNQAAAAAGQEMKRRGAGVGGRLRPHRSCETHWHPESNSSNSKQFVPLQNLREQSSLGVNSQKAEHLSRRVQRQITTPYREQKELMVVERSSTHTACLSKALLLLHRVCNRA